MRFTKVDILAEFDRQDRSYRLAILCTHWLRDTARYKPSAADEAKGMWMKFDNRWVTFADLSALLETKPSRSVLSSDFILNQLHALIRAPFELLSDYFEDYESTRLRSKCYNA